MSKEPVFVSIVSEDERFNEVSGKHNFHSIKNKAVAYVREGDKLRSFTSPPYYLSYNKTDWWLIQSADDFASTSDFWIRLTTKGLQYNIANIELYMKYFN